MTDDEAKAFWATKSPSDVATLLRAAPRVAGPWVENRSDHVLTARGGVVCVPYWERPIEHATELGDHFEAAKVWGNGVDWQWRGPKYDGPSGECDSLPEAQAAADAALTAAGWVLLP